MVNGPPITGAFPEWGTQAVASTRGFGLREHDPCSSRPPPARQHAGPQVERRLGTARDAEAQRVGVGLP
jgi:hypothetical protein